MNIREVQFNVIAEVKHTTGVDRQNILSNLKHLKRNLDNLSKKELGEILTECIFNIDNLSKTLHSIEGKI